MRCVCSSTVPCGHLSRQALRVFCRGLARSHLHRIVLLGKETFSSYSPSCRTYQQTSGNENISRYLIFNRERVHSRDARLYQRCPKQGACHRATRPHSRSHQHRLYETAPDSSSKGDPVVAFHTCTVSLGCSSLVLPVAEAMHTPVGDHATAQMGAVWPR